MGTQLDHIIKQRNKAYSIFTVTRDKFEKAIEDARDYITRNQEEVERLTQETHNYRDTNTYLLIEINSMEKSVNEINKIIG